MNEIMEMIPVYIRQLLFIAMVLLMIGVAIGVFVKPNNENDADIETWDNGLAVVLPLETP